MSDRVDIRLIPGHPKYGASVDGRIWSRCLGSWRVLSTSLDMKGQPKINITGGKTFKVHTLIALTFLGPRPDKHDVDHIDGEKQNTARCRILSTAPGLGTSFELSRRVGYPILTKL